MSNEWYYAKAGKKEGPVSIDDLKRLVQQSQLQPTDHVWKQGMAAWVPASTVEGLFGAEPPPLPPPVPTLTPLRQQPAAFSKEWMDSWLSWLDQNKIAICAGTFVSGVFLAFVAGRLNADEAIPLFLGVAVAPVCYFWIRWINDQKRKEQLHGLWEPISGDGIYFQFTKDGALIRGDGVATRYRWLANNKIELYTDDTSPKAEIEILSLSKSELIVRADGQGGHFKKGVTVTEQASNEAWSKAGAIAGGAAMLALGGLAVLGGMAAGAGGSMSGGGGGRPKCTNCWGSGIAPETGGGLLGSGPAKPCEYCLGRGYK